jgi:hypothetical protein
VHWSPKVLLEKGLPQILPFRKEKFPQGWYRTLVSYTSNFLLFSFQLIGC